MSTSTNQELSLKPKIHLLMSVYLTDTPLPETSYYRKSYSPVQNKVEQFLSTIHSLSHILFSTAEINFQVSSEYNRFTNLILNTIRRYIPNAEISSKRFELFSDWKNAAERIPREAEVVLLKTNHDHVFTHSDPNVFYKFMHDLNSFSTKYVGEISHWPESIGNLRSGKWVKFRSGDFYFVSKAAKTIGTCLIHPDFFKSWWITDFTHGSRIVRPDNPFGPWVEFAPVSRVVPTCEFFRHLDGYGYAKVNAPIASPLRACCTIDGNTIKHLDWTKGNFLYNQKKYELPIEPKLNVVNSIGTLINLALLGTAYKVNLKNLWFMSRAFQFKLSKLSFLLFFLCLSDRFFLRKLFNLILPIYSGNTQLFNLRMYFVRRYSKLSQSYNLPPSLRELFKAKN